MPYYVSWTQYFVHDKSSAISQFINGNSRDLQKLSRHLSGIVTSVYKHGQGGWFTPPSFSGPSGVFPAIFVSYSNDLPSEVLSSTLSISFLY